ncbi:MAG TPA: N-formylglutamate amidohydrolase [Caulobacteraceae bacterium]|jgi:predicted N-formylglutamate amidohydrolase
MTLYSLLGREDPAPVQVSGAGSDSPFLIVVDHAGRATPKRLDRLGLAETAFDLHIAYDIGALELARRMADPLGAQVISQLYSRLVIDCNRAPDQAGAIVEVSDGVTVPGNRGLTPEERAARVREIHRPYHDRIGRALAARRGAGLQTVLVCQHSFTPSLGGAARPWDVGVLHLGDSAVSRTMLTLLRAEGDLKVGDNQPYAMDGADFTAPFHVRTQGCEMLELEVRQDLIVDAAGQAAMAARLARLAPLALARSASL